MVVQGLFTGPFRINDRGPFLSRDLYHKGESNADVQQGINEIFKTNLFRPRIQLSLMYKFWHVKERAYQPLSVRPA